MRFFSGLILGVLLTVGTAYAVDAMHRDPAPDQTASAPMVNWTVVDANVRTLSADLREGWTRLVGGARELDRKTGA